MSIPIAQDHFAEADSHNTILRITGSLHFRAFIGNGMVLWMWRGEKGNVKEKRYCKMPERA